jgi:plastocyanin
MISKNILLNGLSVLFLFIFISAAQAGTISGTAVYEGKVPSFKPIKMDADPICLTKHSGEIFPQTLVLGEGNTMANVFVQIKSGLSKKNYPAPAEEVVITQEGCQYDPHVMGVMVGQTVKILNPDGTLHNVHALPKVNAEFNLAMPKFRTEMTKVFDKPEFMFPIKCDVHPWMGAWITVMEHPYFAVSQENGQFIITNVPAGTYEVGAWHEKLGTQTATVTVGGDETQTVDFKFSRPAN